MRTAPPVESRDLGQAGESGGDASVRAEVTPVIVSNDGAQRHKLEAPKEAVVDGQTILSLALVLHPGRKHTKKLRRQADPSGSLHVI